MELFILRHGEAGKRVPVASTDSERSLTVAGKEEVKEVAQSIADLGLKFDLIATSPLKRSLETAEIAAKVLKREKALEKWDELKPEGETKALYRRLAKLRQDSSVLLVGHEPYLSEMVGELIGRRGARVSIKKSGLVRVELTSLVPTPSGELRWLLTPRLLRKVR